MEWLRFESYTATIYHGCSSYPTLLVGGPEPGWEGNTDKVMYWHGPRMLRYTYYLLACVWKVYLQWGTSPICGVRKWPLYLYIKNETVCRIGSEVHGLYILYIDKKCLWPCPATYSDLPPIGPYGWQMREWNIHTYIHTTLLTIVTYRGDKQTIHVVRSLPVIHPVPLHHIFLDASISSE